MKTTLTILILALNIFSIILNTKMLKGFDKAKMIRFLIIGEIVLFIISNISYAISSFGVPSEIHKGAKWMILLTMLPVNMILIFCPIISQINKKSFDEITDEQYKRRMLLFIIVAIILIVFETIYVKNIQLGILDISNKG